VIDAPPLLALAKRQYGAGKIDEACESCRHVLDEDPENIAALELLGVVAGQRGDTAAAIGLLERAVALRPREVGLLANLGALYRAAGRIDEAAARYREALAVDPGATAARFNLANLLAARGAQDEALRDYALVLERDTAHAGALNNMAGLLTARGHFAEAEIAYRRLIELAPKDAAARSNFGALLLECGQTDAAIALHREAIALDPNAQKPRNNLGIALLEAGAFDEAVACLQESAEIDPSVADVQENLGNAYRKIGAADEAARCYERALAISGASGVRFKRATLLPVIADSRASLDHWHEDLAMEVDRLLQITPPLRDPYAEVGVTTFNLSYHDTNNREVQAKLAQAYLKSCPSLTYRAPHCGKARSGRAPLKIGFISRQFATNAVGWCFQGLLRHLPRNDISVTALRFGDSDDPLWRAIVDDVDAVEILPSALTVARERIAALELDVLVYTDIGMEPLTYFLAFARLAPLQCVLGGHPDTIGIPAIDLFISSDLQEPPDADDHYSERLIRLPGAPTYYDRPSLPHPLKPRAAFDLPEKAALYFCAQTLIKIHPDMDALFAGILVRDPDGLLVFPSGYNPRLAGLLRERLASSLGPLAARVRFLPALSHRDFMNVMALADVSLDTRPFGGGNTSWQAIAAGTPIVTWPGRFLRGRYTQALYRLVGAEDTVVDSTDGYIDTAVRIACDDVFRAEFRMRVEAGADRIFSDMTHVTALRDVLLRYAADQS